MAKVWVVRERLWRYTREIGQLLDQCGHWGEELEGALVQAHTALSVAHTSLRTWPDNVIPPRKTVVRQYERVKAGDMVVVAERARKRTPEVLREARLTVVSVDGAMAVVVVDGSPVQYGVERKVLRMAPAAG